MSRVEFLVWAELYKANPFDDYHRYHRPAALVSVALGGGDVQARLDWLQPRPDDGLTAADHQLFKAGSA